MSNPLNSLKMLAESASKLSRNPLGIIALFIIFIYAFASLVVGFSSQLEAGQKTPLIWFLVVFPVLVLGVFTWFVTCHHSKLYAPSDFRDDEGFIRSMSVQERVVKILKDVESAHTTGLRSVPAAIVGDANIEAQSIVSATEFGRAEREALPPPGARLVMRVVNAEKYVMQDLSVDYGKNDLLTNLTLNLPTGSVEVDGVLVLRDFFIAVDVKYITSPQPPNAIVSRIVTHMNEVGSGITAMQKTRQFKFIFALVTDEMDKAAGNSLAESVRKGLKERCHFPHEVRHYDFETLEKNYGGSATVLP